MNTQFQPSADRKIIEAMLAEAKVGDVVTYEAMSKAIGRDVRRYAIGALAGARRHLLHDGNIVFDVIPRVGLKRLDDGAIVASTASDRLKMQRHANRTIRKLGCVEFEKLDDASKRKHVVASAQFGAVKMFSAAAATKKIEAKVDGAKPLPVGETLKLFGG